MTAKEKKTKALYNWLINQGTPSRIASMFVNVISWKVMNMIIEDEGIKWK